MNLEFVNVYIDNMSAAAMKLALEKVAQKIHEEGAVANADFQYALVIAVKEVSGE